MKEISEKNCDKPLSSDAYEQVLQLEFNRKQLVAEFKYPLEARSILIPSIARATELKITMTDTNNSDKEALYKLIVAAYNYVYFDKSAAVTAKNLYFAVVPRFVDWLNSAEISNRFEVLKEYETYNFDKRNNHGGASSLTPLKTVFTYAIDMSVELHEHLTTPELSYLWDLRKTKVSPYFMKSHLSLASYFGSIDWLRRDDVGIGNELYTALASPKLTVKSLSLTAATLIIVLAKYKQELRIFFKKEGFDSSLFLIPDELSHTKKRHFVGNTIYRLISSYHRAKTCSLMLKGALEAVLLSNSSNVKSFQLLQSALVSKAQCDDLFNNKSLFKERLSIAFCANSFSQVMTGNLFSFEVLRQLFLDEYSCPVTLIEELMFSWLMASQCVQPYDISKLTNGSFRLLKVGGKVRYIECEYFKGRAKIFHTTRSLSVRTFEGEALVIYLAMKKEGEFLFNKREMFLSNGVNSLVGTLSNLLTTNVMLVSLAEYHKKQDCIPLIMPRALIALIQNEPENITNIVSKSIESFSGGGISKPEEKSDLVGPAKLFGLQAIKNSAVHAFSDPYTLDYLINRNSHTNKTEKRHYLNSNNEEWINSAGRITREVMLDLINNVFDLGFEDLNDSEQKDAVERFNSEFMAVSEGVSYKTSEMLSRLRIITGQNKGKVNEVGILKLDTFEDIQNLSPLYVIDSPVTVWKMINYLHEFKKHYRKLLSRNPEYLYKTVMPTVEWVEYTLNQFSKKNHCAGRELFENAIRNSVVVSVFHSI